jgi:hypothetical protein
MLAVKIPGVNLKLSHFLKPQKGHHIQTFLSRIERNGKSLLKREIFIIG